MRGGNSSFCSSSGLWEGSVGSCECKLEFPSLLILQTMMMDFHLQSKYPFLFRVSLERKREFDAEMFSQHNDSGTFVLWRLYGPTLSVSANLSDIPICHRSLTVHCHLHHTIIHHCLRLQQCHLSRTSQKAVVHESIRRLRRFVSGAPKLATHVACDFSNLATRVEWNRTCSISCRVACDD